jgi:hypothetical protein
MRNPARLDSRESAKSQCIVLSDQSYENCRAGALLKRLSRGTAGNQPIPLLISIAISSGTMRHILGTGLILTFAGIGLAQDSFPPGGPPLPAVRNVAQAEVIRAHRPSPVSKNLRFHDSCRTIPSGLQICIKTVAIPVSKSTSQDR